MVLTMIVFWQFQHKCGFCLIFQGQNLMEFGTSYELVPLWTLGTHVLLTFNTEFMCNICDTLARTNIAFLFGVGRCWWCLCIYQFLGWRYFSASYQPHHSVFETLHHTTDIELTPRVPFTQTQSQALKTERVEAWKHGWFHHKLSTPGTFRYIASHFNRILRRRHLQF